MSSSHSILELTPVQQRRKKHPSFNPVKHLEFLSPIPLRATSASPMKKLESDDVVDGGLEGANLVFKEFSFETPKGRISNISAGHMAGLRRYLEEKYDVDDMICSGIFLIIFCRGDVPASHQRPFTIAGLIGVWLSQEDPYPSDLLLVSPPVEGEDLTIDERLAEDLEPYRLPSIASLVELWKRYFSEALSVQYFVTGVIVELSEVSHVAHCERMSSLPSSFRNSTASLGFTNGPRRLTQLARMKQPQPSVFNGEEDDTDYIQALGYASPGVLIKSTIGDEISAGILVEKGGEKRLTVAIQCWDAELKSKPEQLGDPGSFTLTQGRTRIGHVTERIGITDIGLAVLGKDVVFSNRFLDIPASAKSLLAFQDINFNDKFMVDSFVTGMQKLSCLGCIVRKATGRERDFLQKRDGKGNTAPLPSDGVFTLFSQGIYATSAPENNSWPKIRAGVCGAALVRCRRAGDKSTMEDVLANGEIGGFMQWTDLERNSMPPGDLVCLSDCLDPLIEAGWTVVQGDDEQSLGGPREKKQKIS